MDISAVLDWISRNRETLVWLGGGISTVAVGAWAVIRYVLRWPPTQDDLQVISPGLAVGYYYNFLDVVSAVLEDGTFNIENEAGSTSSAGDKLPSSRTVDPANVRIEVIVPARLDGAAFQRCSDEFDQSIKGTVYLRRQKRKYGINYQVTSGDKTERITIIDFARPVMALKRYYEQIVKLGTDNNDDSWQKVQRAEIEAFRKTLLMLQSSGYGALVNKLDIIERG
jgi:hypothetical protein